MNIFLEDYALDSRCIYVEVQILMWIVVSIWKFTFHVTVFLGLFVYLLILTLILLMLIISIVPDWQFFKFGWLSSIACSF